MYFPCSSTIRLCATLDASSFTLNCPDESMLISRFAICTSTLPTTCFETSKNQILSGRCGRSLHLLYTNANNARHPNAPCTRIAKEPRSLHSPFSGGLSCGPCFEAALAVALAMAAIVEEEGMSTPIFRTEEAVAIAEERKPVGVAFSRREATEGSKPGGGCMS